MTKHFVSAAIAAVFISIGCGCCSWHSCGGGCSNDCNQCGSSCGQCGGDSCGGGWGPSCSSCSTCNNCGDCGSCGDCNSCGSCGSGWCWPHTCWFQSSNCNDCSDCPNGGCGSLHICDWLSYPPTCDPCDCCGNYNGCHDPRPCYQMSPRCGSLPMHGGPVDGGMIDGIQYEGKKPKPAAQPTAKASPKNAQHVANNALAANPQPRNNQRYYGNPNSNTKSSATPSKNTPGTSYGSMQFDDGSKLPPGAKVVSDTVRE